MVNIKHIAEQITDKYPLSNFEYADSVQTNESEVDILIYRVYEDIKIVDAMLHFDFDMYLSVSLYVMLNDGTFGYEGMLNAFDLAECEEFDPTGGNLEKYLLSVSRYAC